MFGMMGRVKGPAVAYTLVAGSGRLNGRFEKGVVLKNTGILGVAVC